ncbi:MAG: hypothetical protein ABFE08_17125 [Armatimonadia bacterium]
MRHSGRLSTLVVLLLALTATGVWAQDEAVTLRYKFVPGQTAELAMKGTGTMPMSITPGPEAGGANMAFDIIMDMTMDMMQKTASVDAQGGHFEQTMPCMTIRTTMQVMGQPTEVVVSWKDGAVCTTVNGQVQPLDENMKKMQQMLSQTMKMTMDPLGKTTPDPETAKAMAAMFNPSGLGGVDFGKLGALTSALPEQAVKVGDTWELKDEAKLGEATMTGASTMKLAGFEVVEGRRMAKIEGQARLTAQGQMPGGAAMGMPVNVNITSLDVALAFVNHFDIEAGVVAVSEMNLCQNMQMMLTVPAAMAGQEMHIPASIENAQMTMETRRK